MAASSIDQEQPKSIEEHFKLILDDEALIDSTYSAVAPTDLPPWFDEKLFKKGQDFYKSYSLGVTTSALTGLMAVFLIPTIARVLLFTEKSSVPCSAFKRYLETLLHVLNVYWHDPKDGESKFYKSINTIRWKHSNSSKRYMKKKEEPGILQRDMVLTQFGLIGYVFVCPDKLGVPEDSEEKEGFNHLWRVVSHLLGIPDRINLCRRNKYETAMLCEKILHEVYGKYLDDPSKDFFSLTEASLSGIKSLDPLIDMEAFLVFFYDLHNKKYEGRVSWPSRLNAGYRKLNFKLIRTPYIGFFVRHFWNYYLKITTWLNEKYPVIAWVRFGKSNSKINLYPALT